MNERHMLSLSILIRTYNEAVSTEVLYNISPNQLS